MRWSAADYLAVAPRQTEDDRRLRTHELGHAIAAWHYNLPADPLVLGEAEQIRHGNGEVVVGECSLPVSGTAFQNAVVGWAGVLAQALLEGKHCLGSMPFPLRQDTLREWHAAAMCRLGKLSLADRMLITGWKRGAFLPMGAGRRGFAERPAWWSG